MSTPYAFDQRSSLVSVDRRSQKGIVKEAITVQKGLFYVSRWQKYSQDGVAATL
jgi:hypothetical protein